MRKFLILLLTLASGVAIAQTAPVPQPPPEAGAFRDLLSLISKTVETSFQEIAHNDELAAVGKSLTYLLFALVMSWNLTKTMVNGEGVKGVVAEIIPLVGGLAIITSLLSGGVSQIIGFMDWLAQKFGASQGITQDINTAIYHGMTAVLEVLRMPSLSTNLP